MFSSDFRIDDRLHPGVVGLFAGSLVIGGGGAFLLAGLFGVGGALALLIAAAGAVTASALVSIPAARLQDKNRPEPVKAHPGMAHIKARTEIRRARARQAAAEAASAR